MEERRFYSHAQTERIMRRWGYTQEQIEGVPRDLPDPIDLDRERDLNALFKHGITPERLMDRMGGSP